MIRAKFVCNSCSKFFVKGWGSTPDHYSYTFEFSVVTGNTEENKKFFESTPSGSVKLNGIREDLFEVGKEYYLDFTAA